MNGRIIDCNSIADKKVTLELDGRQLKLLHNGLTLLMEYETQHCDSCEEALADLHATILTKLTFMVSEATGKSALDLLKEWGYDTHPSDN